MSTIHPGEARHGIQPSPWLLRFIGGVRQGGLVLDLACGRGRHIGPCVERGLRVVAVDRDISQLSGLAPGPALTITEVDLEDGRPFPFPPGSFDGIIVTNYLWRPLLPAIVAAVAPGGVLIYETFGVGNERYGKPSNPDFLLRPGELLDAVVGRFWVVAYEHVTLRDPPRVVQRIAAVNGDHAWRQAPPQN